MNNRFKTSNGITMLRCKPLSWEIIKRYSITLDGKLNPEDLVIHIGGLDEMYQALLNLDTMILSFTNSGWDSDDGVYRFKVKTIEDASILVMQFAEGMNKVDSFKGTIYLD